MDRKAWFVVILCAIGMMANFYVMQQQQRDAIIAQAKAQASAPPATVENPAATTTNPAIPTPPPEAKPQEIALTTDRAIFHITTKGGGISRAELLTESGKEEIHLELNKNSADPIGALAGPAVLQPNGKPLRQRETRTYAVVESSPSKVVLEAPAENGLVIRKTFEALAASGKDPHLVRLDVEFRNTGTAPWSASGYSLFCGTAGKVEKDDFINPGFFWNDSGDADYKESPKFDKGWFSAEPMELRTDLAEMRWGGVMDRFNAIIVTPLERKGGYIWGQREYYNDQGKTIPLVLAGISLPDLNIAPAASQTMAFEIYAGPKEYRRLSQLEDGRRQVMFYGMFSWVSRIMMNTMGLFHGWTWSWGWAIVLLTILIRLLLWPLHTHSQRSMKKMAGLQDDMKILKERYSDNPQRLNQEMMKMYKDKGVNPMQGCLPIFIQIPIFFGFFNVLRSAAELRGESFLWWIKDLSMPDTIAHVFGIPLNPLPIIMGVTMFLQMQMTPKTGDATMRRVMMFMPIMFLFFCYNYASGLALYWTTQNIFSIGQTWLTKKWDTAKEAKLAQNPVIIPVSATVTSTSKTKPRPGPARHGSTKKKK